MRKWIIKKIVRLFRCSERYLMIVGTNGEIIFE